MIEHDTKRRHGVADAEHGFEQRHARVRRVHHEVRFGETLEAADEIRVRGLLRDVSSPEVPVTDPAEERVLVVSLEVLGKLRLVRLQIADDADHDGVSLHDLEHPQVVFDPRARLDLDRADDTERDCEPAIALGVGGDWSCARRRPGTAVRCALRTRGIEEVNVGVDDGNRRRLRDVGLWGPRHRGGSGCRRDAGQEGSARTPLLHRVLPRESFRIRRAREGLKILHEQKRLMSRHCCAHPGGSRRGLVSHDVGARESSAALMTGRISSFTHPAYGAENTRMPAKVATLTASCRSGIEMRLRRRSGACKASPAGSHCFGPTSGRVSRRVGATWRCATQVPPRSFWGG